MERTDDEVVDGFREVGNRLARRALVRAFWEGAKYICPYCYNSRLAMMGAVGPGMNGVVCVDGYTLDDIEKLHGVPWGKCGLCGKTCKLTQALTEAQASERKAACAWYDGRTKPPVKYELDAATQALLADFKAGMEVMGQLFRKACEAVAGEMQALVKNAHPFARLFVTGPKSNIGAFVHGRGYPDEDKSVWVMVNNEGRFEKGSFKDPGQLDNFIAFLKDAREKVWPSAETQGDAGSRSGVSVTIPEGMERRTAEQIRDEILQNLRGDMTAEQKDQAAGLAKMHAFYDQEINKAIIGSGVPKELLSGRESQSWEHKQEYTGLQRVMIADDPTKPQEAAEPITVEVMRTLE